MQEYQQAVVTVLGKRGNYFAHDYTVDQHDGDVEGAFPSTVSSEIVQPFNVERASTHDKDPVSASHNDIEAVTGSARASRAVLLNWECTGCMLINVRLALFAILVAAYVRMSVMYYSQCEIIVCSNQIECVWGEEREESNLSVIINKDFNLDEIDRF